MLQLTINRPTISSTQWSLRAANLDMRKGNKRESELNSGIYIGPIHCRNKVYIQKGGSFKSNLWNTLQGSLPRYELGLVYPAKIYVLGVTKKVKSTTAKNAVTQPTI